jgi:hypothetical protein
MESLTGREIAVRQRPQPTDDSLAQQGTGAPPEARQQPAASEREQIADEIMRLLEERGVPSGAWLVDIAQARNALQSADALLRRLEAAIIRSASSAPPDPR